MFMIVCIAGGVMQGSINVATTTLTAAIVLDTDADGTPGEAEDDCPDISVSSTEGFPVPGVIQIGDERFSYSKVTATTFTETAGQPALRAQQGTDAATHAVGAGVRTIEGSMLNTAINHNVATIADASGIWAVPTVVLALFRILGSFLILPLGFLGTDLMLIGVLWYTMAAGMLISIVLSLAGGRRV